MLGSGMEACFFLGWRCQHVPYSFAMPLLEMHMEAFHFAEDATPSNVWDIAITIADYANTPKKPNFRIMLMI